MRKFAVVRALNTLVDVSIINKKLEIKMEAANVKKTKTGELRKTFLRARPNFQNRTARNLERRRNEATFLSIWRSQKLFSFWHYPAFNLSLRGSWLKILLCGLENSSWDIHFILAEALGWCDQRANLEMLEQCFSWLQMSTSRENPVWRTKQVPSTEKLD